MTKLQASQQETDLTLPPNCNGFGRIHHFRREQSPLWMPNPLPMMPAAKYLGTPVADVLPTQVFQLGACDFRCWYCYVDFALLSANPRHSEMASPRDLLEMMLREGVSSRIIDLSGGQPELVPEYPLWFLEARKELGLVDSHFVWGDDNLSNDYLWRYLTDSQIAFMVQSPGFTRVGCIKGYDAESFTFNTKADGALLEQQLVLLARSVAAGFDQYGYITLATPNLDDVDGKVARLLDSIQEMVHPRFPLRTVPLHIFAFNANATRYEKQAGENQYRVLDAWQRELQRRFTASELAQPITEVNIRK